MNVNRQTVLVLGAGILIGLTTAITSSVFADRSGHTVLPLEDLRTFTEVYGKVKADYVEAVDDTTLLEHAIRGMLAGLDPHSAFLNRDEFKELQVGTSGEFGGLGIEVSMEDGFVKVVSPIDDTPAQRAGIQAGDLIIRLDDTPVKGMTLNDAVKVMRGKPGTDINLTVVREGAQKPLQITITRAVIKVRSVKQRQLEPGYGYLRLTNFQTHTADDLARAVATLRDGSETPLKGLVLDLRNNPGGVLGAAVAVSDAFLEEGLIVYTEGRSNDAGLRFNATPDDLIDGAPMVVLINGGSASASEIVAGALQDHQRAVIMGSRSFGKGSVQTIFPMNNDTAVKLTTARYYTPAGRSIQAEGIIPDVEVEALKLAADEPSEVEPLKEANLSRHLSNGNGNSDHDSDTSRTPESASDGDDSADSASLVTSDYVLHEALTLLKGLHILSARR